MAFPTVIKLHKAPEGLKDTGQFIPSPTPDRPLAGHPPALLPAITLDSGAAETLALAANPSQEERSKKDTSTCLCLLLKQNAQSAEAERVDQDGTLHVSTVGAQGGQAMRAGRAGNRTNGKRPQAPIAQ